jgi:hypothetical protein
MLLRNVEVSPNYTTLQPRRSYLHSYRRENVNPTYIYEFFGVFRASLVLNFVCGRHSSVVANGIALKTPQCTVGNYFSVWTYIHLAQDRYQWLVIVSELS